MTQDEIAAQAFEVLKQVAAKRTTITYGGLGRRIDTFHLSTFGPLKVIWRWCEDRGLPHLNALVVNQNTNMPGEGYTPNGKPVAREEWDEIKQMVYRFEWTEIEWIDR